MKIAGIVAEYNPFHKGHAWHVQKTRQVTGCDYIVACMAGHFTQRGEPTPWSKWARARMALACGVDAVFELPVLFAVRTADAFARGGVAILGGLGCDALSFGSEAEIDLLRGMADLRKHEPEQLSERVRQNLEAGMSHARARGEAVAEALGVAFGDVNRPNAILAAEYIRAIDEQGFDMRPVAVKRVGDYHGGDLDGFASASAIREALNRGETDAALFSAGSRVTLTRTHDPDETTFGGTVCESAWLAEDGAYTVRILPDAGVDLALGMCVTVRTMED